MRYRIAASIAALTLAASLYLSLSPEPAAAPSAAAPVLAPSAPSGVARVGATSLREAKPRHVRAARRVKPTATAPSRPVTVHAPSQVSTPPQHNPTGDGYHGSVAALIRSVFGSAAPTALAIAWRESRFDPYAANSHSSARGLFQLMSGWYSGEWGRRWGIGPFNPFSAYANVRAAHIMYLHLGWSPWG